MQQDPYVAPVSQATDSAVASAGYVEGGRSVAAAHGLQWLTSGWRLFRRQAGMWVLLTLALGLIVFGLAHIPRLGHIAITLLTPVFLGGLMVGCRKVEAGEELDIADLFAGFRRCPGKLVLVGAIGIALSIIVMVPAVVILGATDFAALIAGKVEALGANAMISVLVFLALVVPVNMALWFAPALVALHGESAARAIGQSFRGCLKNIAAFLIYGALLLLLTIIATLAAALGWLVVVAVLVVLVPVLVGSMYASYRDIFLKA